MLALCELKYLAPGVTAWGISMPRSTGGTDFQQQKLQDAKIWYNIDKTILNYDDYLYIRRSNDRY